MFYGAGRQGVTESRESAMEFRERLAYLMERRSIRNAAELSRRTGLTQVAIRNYLRGIKFPNSQALVKLGGALNTTADYLLAGAPRRPDRIPLFPEIPPGTPEDWAAGDFPAGFGEEYLDRGDIADRWAFALIVGNDAMSPRLNPGDIVIVSPEAAVEHRAIAAVRLAGGERLLAGVLFLPDGRVLLQPENAKYEPRVVTRAEVGMLGRVVERREKL